MREVLSSFKIVLFLLEFPTTFRMSYLTIFQQALKKSTLKPSGPGALPFCISLRTPLISSSVTSLLRLNLSSLDTNLGIYFVQSLMKCSLSEMGSLAIPRKCWTNLASMSLWELRSCPPLSLIEEILLWALFTNVDLWKNLVFHSPSFSHCTLDFCLQNIPSYLQKFSHSCWSLLAFSFLTFSKPTEIRTWFSPCNLFSTDFFPSKILPYSFLFQYFSLHLICFNLLWRRNILVPWMCKSSNHQPKMLLMKSGWESHIFKSERSIAGGTYSFDL